MNIYKDTMPPIFVALRLTMVILIGLIFVILLNLFTYTKISESKNNSEKKINSQMYPEAVIFNKKELNNFDNRNNSFFEAYDSSNNLAGYVFFYDYNDYEDSIKLAVAINADKKIKNIKIMDNYRIINSISNLSNFDNYLDKIKSQDIKKIESFKNCMVFFVNDLPDYKNQIAFNSIIECLQKIYAVLKSNNK